jgi:hypothetical protein
VGSTRAGLDFLKERLGSLSRPGIKLRFLGRPACILIIISTMISRLPLSGVKIRYDWFCNLFSPYRQNFFQVFSSSATIRVCVRFVST